LQKRVWTAWSQAARGDAAGSDGATGIQTRYGPRGARWGCRRTRIDL